ncbi:hypothetical protein [Scytonema sp. NUACC21]
MNKTHIVSTAVSNFEGVLDVDGEVCATAAQLQITKIITAKNKQDDQVDDNQLFWRFNFLSFGLNISFIHHPYHRHT